MSKIEEASEQIRQLAQESIVEQLSKSNEAETRLLLIDRVLAILGWPLDEYKPEQATSNGGYTDYRLTIDGHPRLIVEAKRFGLNLPLPKTLSQPQYKNSFLSKSCGDDITALLDQCRRYCSDCGVRYAVATTGKVWIILVGFIDGLAWGNLQSFVFHSLADVATRFSLFYDLISRDAVRRSSLEDHFGSTILVKPTTAIRPREDLTIGSDLDLMHDRGAAERFFDAFMGDLTRESRADMLQRCYVSNREIEEFTRDLRTLLEYDAVLDEQEDPVKDVDEEKLRKAIEEQWSGEAPRTILLAGRIGAGKSTFIHRFVRSQATAKNTVCVVIDLINRAARQGEQTETEVQAISELILNDLFGRFREKFDPFDPSVLRACFRQQVEQFKARHPELLRRREEDYLLAEEEYLNRLCEDKFKHLAGYAQFLRNKKYKLWIALDNIDQGTYSYQEFVYAFAHQLSSESKAVTLITLREDTFLEAVEAGFLNVRSSDLVFRLNPPELRQVIAKRRRYVDHLVEHGRVPRALSLSKTFVRALSWHLKVLFLGQDDRLRRYVSALSLGNLRDSLQLIEDYYTSSHSLFHGLYQQYAEDYEEGLPDDDWVDLASEHAHFIQALMLRNGWTYDEKESRIYNLFAVGTEEQSSHFIALAILAYLSRERVSPKNTVQVRQLCQELLFFGYPRHHVESVARRMLGDSLLFSPRVSVGMSRRKELPELTSEAKVGISAKGYYFLTQLAGDAYYQVRAAEDTIWYDEERASAFIRELRESFSAQQSNDPDDLLIASGAREVFFQYLKRAWLHECQVNQARVNISWARVVNNIVEERVFGTQLTRSVHNQESTTSPHVETGPVQQSIVPVVPKQLRHKSDKADNVQLSIFPELTDTTEQGFQKAADSLGPMPENTKVHRSVYLFRVLWALEVASRAGLSPIRASTIAQVINSYGTVGVEATNVAKFLRNQRQSAEFTHFWRESPLGFYALSNLGREFLLSQLEDRRVINPQETTT